MMYWRAASVFSLLFVLSAGCGSSKTSNTSPQREQCTPNPELIARHDACQTDADCPCGSNCTLGQCVADCAVDADCADDQVCGEYGRCADEGVDALLPPSRNPAGGMTFDRHQAVLPQESAVEVFLNVGNVAISRARVDARRGAKVLCPGAQEFTYECMLSDLTAGARISLKVYRTDTSRHGEPIADDAVAELAVFTPGHTDTVTLLKPVAGRPDLHPVAGLAGRYEGTMHLSGAGTDRDLEQLAKPAMQMAMPASASVWKSGADTFTIALDDPFHSLSNRDIFIGTLTLANEASPVVDGSAEFAVHPFVTTTVAGRSTVLLSDTVDARVRVDAGGPTLSIELTQSYKGAGAELKPSVRWLIVLQRSADTTGDAPPLPEDATLPADQLARLADPTPWQSAFKSTIAPPTANQALAWAQGVEPSTVAACGGVDNDFLQSVADGLFSPDGLLPGQSRTRPRPLDAAINHALSSQASTASFEWDAADRYTTEQSLAPAVEDDAFPCRFSDVNISVREYGEQGGYVQGLVEIPGIVDECANLQETTGCSVENTDFNTDSGTQNGDLLIHDGSIIKDGSVQPMGLAVQMKVIAVCKMPPVAPNCAEKISCLAPQDPLGAYEADVFAQQGRDAIGDLSCATGGRGASFDFDRRLADAVTSNQWKVVNAISTCLNDLDGLAQPPTDSAATGWDGYNALYGGKSCVDVGRVLTALAVQTESQRSPGNALPDAAQASASAYTQRLLSRWLSLHSFLASESAQVELMAGPLGSSDGTVLGLSQDDMLDKVLHGWDVLLAQHILFEVLNTPASVLAQPDYRAHRFEADFDAKDGARQPLASVILSTLVRQTELLNRRLSRPESTDAAQRLQVIADFMPRDLIALALASDMHAEALRADANLDWDASFELSATRLQAGSAKTFELAKNIREGKNPLGIADGELPLYFRSAQATDAGSRFTTVSDFIAGMGPGSDAWAPTMVASAQAALSDARQATIEKSERQVAEARAERSNAQWLGKVRNDYNRQLYDYCGPSSTDLISADVFNAARCPVITDSPECTFDLKTWLDSWTEDDLNGRICLADALQTSMLGGEGFADADVRNFIAACVPSAQARPSDSISFQTCGADATRVCLHCDADPSVNEVPLDASSLHLSAPTDAPSVVAAWKRARSSCERQYPQMRLTVAPPRSPFDIPGCVGGSLGEAYLDIVAATQDLEQARAQLGEYIESYDIAETSCLRLKERNDDISSESSSHSAIMHNLRAIKAAADSAAEAAGAVKDCAATTAGTSNSTPWDALKGTVATVTACVAGGVQAAANITSIGLQAGMDDAQSDFETKIAGIENAAEVDICHNDAKQQLVGARSATIAIDKAVFDLARARAEVDAQLGDAAQIWADGHAYLEEMTNFPVPSTMGDPWYSERIGKYTRNFKLARRATYLAVRAVEYEFQVSSQLRQKVYQAKVPDDLQAILDEIWTTSATRSVAGSRPAELSAVLSLRDDILQVGDRSDWPEELRQLSAEERFHALLTSQHYAEYDDAGDYVGQRIPFSLLPLGALGLPTNGVSIYAQTDCAERLWSVNASLLGDAMYRGSDTSFVRLDVLKRNTFFSQWCVDPPPTQPFQLASVTPTRNLFREPGVGEDVGSDWGVERGPEAFSRARIQAFFGVDRAALEDPQYANGETSELAARGLYGDYALFIPAALISRDGGDGLVLDHIDDVLLRVDYVSVARP